MTCACPCLNWKPSSPHFLCSHVGRDATRSSVSWTLWNHTTLGTQLSTAVSERATYCLLLVVTLGLGTKLPLPSRISDFFSFPQIDDRIFQPPLLRLYVICTAGSPSLHQRRYSFMPLASLWPLLLWTVLHRGVSCILIQGLATLHPPIIPLLCQIASACVSSSLEELRITWL